MNAVQISARLAKYDVAGPRYTSYPTVPYWEDTPDEAAWLRHVGAALAAAQAGGHGASIYVHVPFCRALCTFCGCNTRVTRTHAIVMPYVQAVLTEYALYQERLGVERPEIGELHLGGGTPTFLEPAELDALVGGILAASRPRRGRRVLDRGRSARHHAASSSRLLAGHGFRRISLGVQDFDPKVQGIVNRVQSVAQVRAVTEQARALGFDSVNFDLIYGLPLQTLESIELTTTEVCALRPDRIALYGYAHVPWIKPGQRRFTEIDLPEGRAKRALYERARERLEAGRLPGDRPRSLRAAERQPVAGHAGGHHAPQFHGLHRRLARCRCWGWVFPRSAMPAMPTCRTKRTCSSTRSASRAASCRSTVAMCSTPKTRCCGGTSCP